MRTDAFATPRDAIVAWDRRTPDAEHAAAFRASSEQADILSRFLAEIREWLENDEPGLDLIGMAEEWREAGCPGITEELSPHGSDAEQEPVFVLMGQSNLIQTGRVSLRTRVRAWFWRTAYRLKGWFRNVGEDS
jgi:hypothetical protein